MKSEEVGLAACVWGGGGLYLHTTSPGSIGMGYLDVYPYITPIVYAKSIYKEGDIKFDKYRLHF